MQPVIANEMPETEMEDGNLTKMKPPEHMVQRCASSVGRVRKVPRVVTGESGIVLCGGMELRLLLELFTR